MYWILWATIVIGTIKEQKDEKNTQKWYIAVFFIMLIMAGLRYGQGTDYFTYENWYKYQVKDDVEIGYVLLTGIMYKIGMSFSTCMSVIVTLEMLLFYSFIKKYSPYKLASVLMLYPTIYLTYMFSLIRQSLALAFFCGIALPFLLEEKYIKYLCGVLLAASFHQTALIMLVLPTICKMKYKYISLLTIPASIAGMGFCLIDLRPLMISLLGGRGAYYASTWGNVDVSVMGIAERTLMMFVIWWASRPYLLEEENKVLNLCKIYTFGYILSILSVRYQLISSRLGSYCKITELVLLPCLMKDMDKKTRKIVLIFLILYSLIFLYKNIWSYIIQGDYQNTNVWTYPWITLFTKELLVFRRNV